MANSVWLIKQKWSRLINSPTFRVSMLSKGHRCGILRSWLIFTQCIRPRLVCLRKKSLLPSSWKCSSRKYVPHEQALSFNILYLVCPLSYSCCASLPVALNLFSYCIVLISFPRFRNAFSKYYKSYSVCCSVMVCWTSVSLVVPWYQAPNSKRACSSQFESEGTISSWEYQRKTFWVSTVWLAHGICYGIWFPSFEKISV